MTQSYPVHISREIERRWASRSHMAKSRVARNDNRAGGLCPIRKEAPRSEQPIAWRISRTADDI